MLDSLAVFYIPQFAVTTAYESTTELDNALGLYLATWGIVTFIFFLGSLKSSVALVSLFACLTVTFFLL
jgi:succinate-acetate transporter protein